MVEIEKKPNYQIQIDREPNNQKYIERQNQLALVYQEAFAEYPWFENLPLSAVLGRLKDNQAKRGFNVFLAQKENSIIGALWYDTPPLDELENERGSTLRGFVESLLKEKKLIWEREIIVKPDQQKQDVATKLRVNFLEYLKQTYKDGALVLTRMREDNVSILKIASRLGFERTGVRKVSSQNPNIFHDYYFKEIY